MQIAKLHIYTKMQEAQPVVLQDTEEVSREDITKKESDALAQLIGRKIVDHTASSISSVYATINSIA